MFSVSDREQRQSNLLSLAENDEEIIGAALVGSSATGKQDALSDIDLALQIAPDANITVVIDRWTELVKNFVPIAHTLDVVAGNGVLYRVFLTSDSMQMDISFWPHGEFRASGDQFRLLFGTPNEPVTPAVPDENRLIGMAWLHALPGRSAIARNEPWHAQALLDDMRDFVLTLACRRHGANAHQLRGVDSLPAALLDRFAQARSATLEKHELRRSLTMHVDLLLDAADALDPELASRLTNPLREIAGIPT